jgi:L-lactate dehydrogenase
LKRSGLPKNRVFGSGTVLDTARLKYLLASRLHVDSRNVHTVIIGEHGDTEFPVNSIANVSGIPLYDFFALENQDGYEAMLAEIQEDVRTSAYEIIKKKGATYYGIAMAVGKICRSIVSDEKSMLPVSVELEGEYGLSGLSISVPCIVGKNGVEQILEMPLNVQERRELKKSADSLKKVIASIDQ